MSRKDETKLGELADAASNGFIITGFGDDKSVMIYLDDFAEAKNVAQAVNALGSEGIPAEIYQEFMNDRLEETRAVKNLSRQGDSPARQCPEPAKPGEHTVFFVRVSLTHQEAEMVFDVPRRKQRLIRQSDENVRDIGFYNFLHRKHPEQGPSR